jgi:hypothetical protein
MLKSTEKNIEALSAKVKAAKGKTLSVDKSALKAVLDDFGAMKKRLTKIGQSVGYK